MYDRGAAAFSPQQRRILDLEGRDKAAVYRVSGLASIDGALDLDTLLEAVRRTVAAHGILWEPLGVDGARAGTSGAGEPASVHVLDATGLDPQSQARTLEELRVQLDARVSGDGSLPRFAVVRTRPERCALLVRVSALRSDALGVQRLLEQLSRSYEAILERRPPGTAGVAYRQVAQILTEMLTDEESAVGRSFWSARAASDFTELPGLGADSAGYTMRSAKIAIPLGDDCVAALDGIASGWNASLDELLLAAWMLLIQRFAQQPLVSVGVALSGRHYDELEGCVGPLKRFVPVATALDLDRTLNEFIPGMREGLSEAGDWQDYYQWDLERSHLSVDGDRPGIPLCFDATLRATAARGGGLVFQLEDIDENVDWFEFKLCVTRLDRLRLELHYNDALHQREEAEQLAGAYATLLGSIRRDPWRPIGLLRVLSVDEERTVATLSEGRAVRYAEPSLAEIFVEQVDRTPDATAVVCAGTRLCYAELGSRVAHLAERLTALDVGSGVPVAAMTGRSLESVVAQLAVLVAGGVFVPVDPTLPAKRIERIVSDTKPSVALLAEGVADREIAWGAAKLLRVPVAPGERRRRRPLPRSVPPSELAYVIYTSGSTGRPLGVMATQEGLRNRVLWSQGCGSGDDPPPTPLAPGDRVLACSAVGFDFAIWETLAPLLWGATLVLAEDDAHRDPKEIVGLVVDQQITVLHLVPSMLSLLLDTESVRSCQSLEKVFSGGEPLSRALAGRFHELLDAQLFNQYGPTETSIDVSFLPCPRSLPRERVPIGRPIANTRLQVLDRDLAALPRGIAGDLYVAGAPLARGYLGRPRETAERFIPDLRSRNPGARQYKTGDGARWLLGGNLEFIGRNDDQLKVRGFRVEPGEISNALLEHPSVESAVVLGRNDRPDELRLVAYWVPRANRPPSEKDLREHLASRLPGYMIPHAFVSLNGLPLTESGKLDRRALPAPIKAAQQEQEIVGPRTPTEAMLAGIWMEVLGDAVGVFDDFFSVGGDSVSAIRIISRIADAKGPVKIAEVFDNPIAALAAIIDERYPE